MGEAHLQAESLKHGLRVCGNDVRGRAIYGRVVEIDGGVFPQNGFQLEQAPVDMPEQSSLINSMPPF